MVQVASSQSTKNGVAPVYAIAFAVAANVRSSTRPRRPAPTPRTTKREVERGGAARERDRVRDAGDRGELALEGVDVRPERRDPVRLDRLRDELRLAAGEVGWGQVDARHRAPSVPGRSGSGSCAAEWRYFRRWQGTA